MVICPKDKLMFCRKIKSPLNVDSLEGREVPAAISLAATGVLNIIGDSGNNYSQVRYATSTQTVNGQATLVENRASLEATIATTAGYRIVKEFPTASVRSIEFSGRGGTDIFLNPTTITSTTTTAAGGIVNGSIMQGSPLNNNPNDQVGLGVFVVSQTGVVEVDYLYCGAGYRAQMGFYSIEGMDSFALGSTAYIQEAARRVLSNSGQGAIVINRNVEGAKFTSTLPWEGNLNSGPYLGPKTVQLTPNGRYGMMLIPNGTFSQLAANPALAGDKRPLFSIPGANPYTVTSQLLGQMGDLTRTGSTFAFEDLRLDGSSDRDYNDIVFQVTGARAVATPIEEVVNQSRNFLTSPVGKTLTDYTLQRQSNDLTSTIGFSSGMFSVGADGRVGLDYLFDGGGYVGQVGLFSLQGMNQYTPGSPEFIREAARRVLSGTTLGGLMIDDFTEGARFATSSEPLLRSFNNGSYPGLKSAKMVPGDIVGIMCVPNGNFFEVFSNPAIAGPKKPIFSMPEANPGQKHQLARVDNAGEVLAFEDILLDGNGILTTDRDYNDFVFRTYGLSPVGMAPPLGSIAAPRGNTTNDWSTTLLGTQLKETREIW
jgi:hypothetical protein